MSWEVCERPINTLQEMIDNTQVPWTVYEDGDQAVYYDLPKRLRHPDGSVKCLQGIMIYDEEEKKVYARGSDGVRCALEDIMAFEVGLNCTQEQLDQVLKHYNWSL